MTDDYTPGKAHEEIVELIWANVPVWDYPTDVDRLAEAIDRYWVAAHDREVRAEAWAEGYDHGFGDGGVNAWGATNPYREDS